MKNNERIPYFVCFISALLLSLAGVMGSLFCIISAFEINVNGYDVAAACVISGVVFSVLTLFPRKASVPLSVVAVGGWIAVLVINSEKFINGFKASASFLMIHYHRFAEVIVPFYDESDLTYYSVTRENTFFFVMTGIALMFIMVMSIANDVSFIVPFSITLPCLASCLFILNTKPSEYAVCALLVFWITLIVTAVLRHSGRPHGAYGILCTLPIMILLSLVIIKAFPQESYTRPEFVDKANKEIIEFLKINTTVIIRPHHIETSGEEQSQTFPTIDPGGSENLRDVGDREVTGKEIMRIYTDRTDTNTLIRGLSRGSLINDTWFEIPDEFFTIENKIISQFGYHPDDISLSAIFKKLNDSRRMPEDIGYEIFIDLLGQRTTTDYRPPYSEKYINVYNHFNDGINVDRESFNFYVPDFDVTKTKVDKDIEKSEKEYSALVKQYFLDYERNAAISDAIRSLDIGKDADLSEKIYKVKKYLKNRAEYSLSPGKTPKNYDFIEYFLNVNRKGYCVHFATAATVLFRALGVPARYVTGYIAKAENYDISQGYITVTDKEAHAWTEVYCDGFGWIPVDVTPGYDAGYIPEVSETSEVSYESSITEESSYNEISENSKEYSRPEASEESYPINASYEVSEISGPERPSGISKEAKIIILVLGLLILAVGGVAANRAIRISIRKKRFTDPDINKAALFVWQYALKLKKHGSEDSERMYEIAEKAKYSRKGIDKDEYAEMLSLAEKCADALYDSSGAFKKLALKYVFALR